MNIPGIVFVSLLAANLTGCSDSSGPDDPPDPGTGLALEDVGTFSFPILLTAPPGDSRLFVVQKGGTIRVVKNGATLATPFLNLAGRISTGGEQGLLGMAFHPSYASNGLFVVNYTDTGGDTRISLFRVGSDPNVADPNSEQVILEVDQPFTNHNGGMLAFGPQDGRLYIGLGDGGSGGDPQNHAQRRNSLLGKMLRLGVSTSGQVSVPSDNPFVGESGTRPEIWSLGLRNPWRFSFDRQTGDLYIADVGQDAWEEINVTSGSGSRGANYGWKIMEGTNCYQASSCNQTGLTLPVVEYPRADGCSVTGGFIYRGTGIPDLAGTYFYGDYCGGWVRSFRWSGSSATERQDWADLAPGGSLVSFGEDAAGELYVISQNGRVARIVSAP
ncbi:MAG: PQQ-dependent sugar dehydrogenase [Gemmatimonadales bacterium]